jgi:predicted flap endonuclease-1-like 5' DNA nuclease
LILGFAGALHTQFVPEKVVTEANNLTLIDGIELWTEEKLHMLDIFTFDQISKLTAEDAETITEVLEIPPGRIDKDKWVSQARKLAKEMEKKKLAK